MSQTQSINQILPANISLADELSRQYGYFSKSSLLKGVLDTLPGIVLVLNRHRQIVIANQAFCDLSGHESADMLCGQLVGDILACHIAHSSDLGCGSGDSCETCGALTAMLADGYGDDNVQECMITRRVADMTQNLTLRVWTSPLKYVDEEFTVMAGMDISHERRRLALERTFFHDIMNLVGSIRGFAELMEIDESIDPLEVSRRIQTASQRVIDEIDAQRVLLAVEKGELQVNNSLLSSTDVLHDTVELYEGQELSRDRRIVVAEDAKDISFVCDATLLRRILGNMTKNALEATAQGGDVVLGVSVDESDLKFWVHNDAVIPKEYQQRIFQRDFSTKGAGRGLGTYSMKLLARFLSGDVYFKTKEGSGTCFVLHVPLVTAEKKDEETI